MTEQPESASSAFVISRHRLECLFDGIFAIAMTILVLELKVPELVDRHSVAELAQALGHHAGTFVSYLLSFLMLGILWHRHNQHYRHLRHITSGMLALHLVQLSLAAFFPFCAAILGRYPTNFFSIVVYTGCLMLYQWATMAEWQVAKRAGAISPELSPADYRRYRRRNLRGCLVTTALFMVYLGNALLLPVPHPAGPAEKPAASDQVKEK